MNSNKDAYGRQFLDEFNNQKPTAEMIERDDGLIETGSKEGMYFSEYENWMPTEQRAIELVRGKVLDVGCGAGRHSLYLQEKGFDVTGIDNSPDAIRVCRLRGLKKAEVVPIEDVEKLAENNFDTVIMFGNNFGLFGSPENAKKILEKFSRITADKAQIIAGTLDPYKTDDPKHLAYHKLNRERGRMAGQNRMRIIYDDAVGEWFDYLFVSFDEMKDILKETSWQIREFIESKGAHYFAVIEKNVRRSLK